MKVLAINGSPREGGNTEILLKEVLKSIEAEGIDTTLIKVGGSGIKPCMACSACFHGKNRKCIMNDDIFNKLFEEMLKAELIEYVAGQGVISPLAAQKAYLGDQKRIEGSLRAIIGQAKDE